MSRPRQGDRCPECGAGYVVMIGRFEHRIECSQFPPKLRAEIEQARERYSPGAASDGVVNLTDADQRRMDEDLQGAMLADAGDARYRGRSIRELEDEAERFRAQVFGRYQ